MTYQQLKVKMGSFHRGEITKTELSAALERWQQREHPVSWPVIAGVITAPQFVIVRWEARGLS